MMHDPDAPGGDFFHWIIYGISPGVSGLSEAVPAKPRIAKPHAFQGVNSFDRIGYSGPAPPPGSVHHYIFRILALDWKTGLKPGATKEELQRVLDGHILAQGALTGTYTREK